MEAKSEREKEMKVDRQDFLLRLQAVRSGLDDRGTAYLSDCYLFSEGDVITYDTEVYCSIGSGLEEDFEGGGS